MFLVHSILDRVPRAHFNLESAAYNGDVNEYIRAREQRFEC